MKKLFTLLETALTALALSVPALADIAVPPEDPAPSTGAPVWPIALALAAAVAVVVLIAALRRGKRKEKHS